MFVVLLSKCLCFLGMAKLQIIPKVLLQETQPYDYYIHKIKAIKNKKTTIDCEIFAFQHHGQQAYTLHFATYGNDNKQMI